MKIAFISAGVLPIPAINGGAVETLVENIINQNEKQKKLDITIFTPAFEKKYLNDYNYKFCNINMIDCPKSIDLIYKIYEHSLCKLFKNKVKKNLYLLNVIKNLNEMNFDAIVIENRPQFILPLRASFSKKIILHLHNDTLNNKTENGFEIFNACDEIFTVSNYIKNRVLTINNSNEDRVKVWFNGIDLNKFSGRYNKKLVKTKRDKHFIKENEFIITFIGRLVDEKGIKELINAFNDLKHKNLVLLVVGSFWYDKNKNNAYVNEIKKLSDDTPHKIIFTGYVEHSDIPLYHSLSDIIVIPSKWEEPCSLAVFEALSSGVSTIVSDSGGSPEIVGENNALIAKREPDFTKNLYLSLNELIKNNELRNELGRNAKKHIKKHSLERFFCDFVDLISKSIKKQR